MDVYNYKTKGVCSTNIKLVIEGDKLNDIEIMGGCNGNLQGINALVKGLHIDDVIARLEGIKCGFKSTSCPDQLACALKQIKEKGDN